MSTRVLLRPLSAIACAWLLASAVPLHAHAAPAPTGVGDALQWRLVGPFRGGWATMAAGDPANPDTFYIGTAGGGVWKTNDAGRTWSPTFDNVPAAPIGAIAVAPSNSSVIYAGSGQVAARYDVAAGNGMYRSDNGGKTWQHIGLDETKHIGAIVVNPRDANTLLVGALGHYFGPNKERGVYRSSDGGKTWTQTLFVDADTGVVDIKADPSNPNIVYAATWQVRNYPWLSYFQPNAGPGSGLYKSTDGGVTWKRIGGNGFPGGSLGRIGLATASGNRVYAVVHDASSRKDSGLYRSDDGGESWQAVSHESWLPNDYFSRITVDPQDPSRIYSAGQSIRRSDDGGKHWDIFKGAPGGDDYHFLWIDPHNSQRMIAASDQGAVVTVNGGKTWSSWYNQPTAQFYHIATDNQFPYWIYSGQQDSGTVGIASRSDYGSISYRDWRPVGGDERDYDLPYPDNANIVFGSGLGGRVSRWDRDTGVVQNVTPWPVSSYGMRPTDFKYHYTWITPIAFSAKAPYALYLGAQVLFRTTDQGQHWDVISPDLSAKKEGATAGCHGNPTAQQARDCGYGVIYSIAPSPFTNDEIWIGTDDGSIQYTRDGGKNWQNVTPKDLPSWGIVSSLDLSTLKQGTAYAAVDNHRQDDFRPHVWRTHDYGKTWTDIAAGLPNDDFVSVVRADTQRDGLLFAGTDRGVFVSLDDGDHWQSLQRNLPTAWVRDLQVHGNDLIVGTQGRAIWILDDITPLRQASADDTRKTVLYTPATAIRVRANENRDTPLPPDEPLGKNPPAGAVIDYRLASSAKGAVTLDILDGDGKVVRHYSSADEHEHLPADRYFQKGWLGSPEALGTSAGAHRFVWDLRYPRPDALLYGYSIAATWDSDTPLTPEGPLVLPGKYEVVLKVDGHAYRAPLNVAMDPRVTLDQNALAQGLSFSRELGDALQQIWQTHGELDAVRDQLDQAQKKLGDDAAHKSLHEEIDAFRKKTDPLVSGDGETSTNLEAMNDALTAIATDVEGADRAPTDGQREAFAQYKASLGKAAAQWQSIRATDLPALNAHLKAAGIKPLTVPAANQIHAEVSDDSDDIP
ncbi:MAG TPA: hypothetical protein VL997_07595 [Dyella sp.]|nr:hypothetical protein [Dyella sp.]